VIAVGSGAGLSMPLFEITTDSAGKWAIVYRPKASVDFRIAGLMPLGELESYLNSAAADAPKAVDAS
jgi:hypothetical protein